MKELHVSCPTCRERSLFYTKYQAPLKILKEREWLYCKKCDYKIQMDEFKKYLCCA